MGEQSALLTLKIDTDEPVELRDFVGAFTSLANEFERFVQTSYDDIKSEPQMYVREVRSGCIEADLFTGLAALAGAAVQHMDQILILEDFVKRWGQRFTFLSKGTVPVGELETMRELKDWADAAKSIASDPVAGHRLEAADFVDGKKRVRASFKFSAPDARTALQHIEDRKKLLNRPETKAYKRVLMVFTRSDVNNSKTGKRSGELVKIEELSEKPMPLVYGSELAEDQIKHEIRESDDNVYHKGFMVDICVKVANGGRPVAYSVTTLHQIIDIGD
ncbi:hypothetical protein PUV47_11670 [Pseudovibrio exalbescens]|uniref:hypothetical protein n=1 Tax=Pseudovibrio exalbescens TaxID=197461 RepID=UPI00236701F6|nr:hypothetical protein [Pseudovibrio exalbescens]MDD7910579.1 hypothetical protein [Pseudovibrio exalbescens]